VRIGGGGKGEGVFLGGRGPGGWAAGGAHTEKRASRARDDGCDDDAHNTQRALPMPGPACGRPIGALWGDPGRRLYIPYLSFCVGERVGWNGSASGCLRCIERAASEWWRRARGEWGRGEGGWGRLTITQLYILPRAHHTHPSHPISSPHGPRTARARCAPPGCRTRRGRGEHLFGCAFFLCHLLRLVGLPLVRLTS
jgi:hypothetical protein